MAVIFGRVPKPEMIVRIVPKAFDGAGYDSCAPRKIVGVCSHCTDGVPPGNDMQQLDWYFNFVAPGGERHDSALWDYTIASGGTIAQFNQDFGGRRRPWANGWGSEGPGLEGDGVAFVAKYGAYGTNFNLASIERVVKSPNPMTPAQLDASAQLEAWIFDQAKVPFDQFPLNPASGIVTDLQHYEFATKPCPGAGIIGQTDELQAKIKSILEHWQVAEDFPAVKSFPKPDSFDHGDFKACRRKVKVRRGGGAEKFQYADPDAPKTGKPYPKNAIVEIIYVVSNSDGNWYVDTSGNRMRQTHFLERVSVISSE